MLGIIRIRMQSSPLRFTAAEENLHDIPLAEALPTALPYGIT